LVKSTKEITKGEEKEASEFEYLEKTAFNVLPEDVTAG